MDSVQELTIGDKVYFLEGKPNVFTVRAKKENFIIATSYDVPEGIQYTIIDTDKGVCGPHDRTFNTYDFDKLSELDRLLNDLIEKKFGIKISSRRGTSVSLVINLPLTLQLV